MALQIVAVRITDCSKYNGVSGLGQFQSRWRQRKAMILVSNTANIGMIHPHIRQVKRIQYAQGFRHYFLTNTVSGKHWNMHVLSLTYVDYILYFAGSPCRAERDYATSLFNRSTNTARDAITSLRRSSKKWRLRKKPATFRPSKMSSQSGLSGSFK